MPKLLLIYPPFAKNCEPPPGIARLAGFLRGNDLACAAIDANCQAHSYLLSQGGHYQDTWSQRASNNLPTNLAYLQGKHYKNFDRYKQAVLEINRLLTMVGRDHGVRLNLANYQDKFSPVVATDLCQSAENYRDNIFYPFFRHHLAPQIEEHQPTHIGISLTYLSQAVIVFALLGFLKQRFPHITNILGGGLVTSWSPNLAWQNHFQGLVDHYIAGPGELPLLSLLGGNNRKICPAPPHYGPQKQEAATGYLAPGPILPYAASSGCYWHKCLFCPETAEGNPYHPLAPDQVLADLTDLTSSYRPILLHFLDNAISPSLQQKLITNPPGPPWYGFARAHPHLADTDFCLALRRSGCLMLKLGLESGDQQVLDSMEKGIELPLVEQVLAALHKAGILTYVYLLFGTPSEDEESARRTMAFTVRHQAEIDFVNLAIFNLPLAGPEANALHVQQFYPGDLSLYADFHHPLGWSRTKVRYFLDKEFSRHPAISPIINRDPPFFTSNHAPLFHPSLINQQPW